MNGRLNGKLITEYLEGAKETTYSTLASDIGVSTGIVRQMEDGYLPRRNTDKILAALAKVLGCSVGALVTPPVAKKAS